jgi:WD40 repeat protein
LNALAVLGIVGGGGAALWQFLAAKNKNEKIVDTQANLDDAQHQIGQLRAQAQQAEMRRDQAERSLRDIDENLQKSTSLLEQKSRLAMESASDAEREKEQLRQQLSKAEQAARNAEQLARAKADKDAEATWRPLLDKADKARAKAELDRTQSEKQWLDVADTYRKQIGTLRRDLYHRQITLADMELKAKRPEKANEYLTACPPEQRHWEWYALSVSLFPRESNSWKVNNVQPRSTALSSDSKLVAASETKLLQVRETATGKLVFELDKELTRVVAFHPRQPTHLAVGYLASQKRPGVIVWDVLNKKEVLNLPDQKGASHLAFDAEGKRLTVSHLKSVHVWDLETKKLVAELKDHPAVVSDLAMSPDGTVVATVNSGSKEDPGRIRIWNASTGAMMHEAKASGLLRRVVFNPDGFRLATSGEYVQMWRLDGLGLRLTYSQKGTTTVLGLAFNKDGSRLYTGDLAGTLRGLNSITGAPAFAVTKLTTIQTVHAGHDDSLLVLGAYTEIKVLSAAQKFSKALDRHAGSVRCLAFAPDSKTLAIGGSNVISICDFPSGKKLHSCEGHEAAITHMQFNKEGTLLASAAKTSKGDAEIKVWGAKSGKEIWSKVAPVHKDSLVLEFTPDGAKLIAAVDKSGGDKSSIWDAATGRELANDRDLPAGNFTRFLGYQPMAKGFARVNAQGDVEAPSPLGGDALTKLLTSRTRIGEPVWSPNGKIFGMARPASFTVWDTASGKVMGILNGPQLNRNRASFTPDGRRLATVSGAAGTGVMLWDLAARQNSLVLPLAGKRVEAVAFSPDGRYLAAGDSDGNITLWGPVVLQEVAEQILPPKGKLK